MQVEYVILVNKHDQSLGAMEKMEAHEKGMMHRAISIFIFNSDGQLLLQQRSGEKYHSPLLWTNTACSHPRTGEQTKAAANRRIVEEMGIDCKIEEAFGFTYKADVGEGLIEHEYDHVFVGYSDEKPKPDPAEVAGWKYVDFDWVVKDVDVNPQDYTVWFPIALKELKTHLMRARRG